MNRFEKHEVNWTEEKITNFWNYFVMNEGLRELSAARTNGKEIVRMAKKYLKKDGNNLDYGCGGGFLMEFLFKRGIQCRGLDSSSKSLEATKNKFKDNHLFKGVILSTDLPNESIKDNSFDFIFLIETMEHLSENKLEMVLKELYRILKINGRIFITVPNNENLDKYKVICPDCGAVFHRVQHMNRFTKDSFDRLMVSKNFKTLFCKGVFLGRNKSLFNKVKYFINYIYALIFRKKLFRPHLVYLGQK